MRCADFDKICVFLRSAYGVLRSAYGVDLCIFPLRYRHGSADLRSPEETGSGANRRINCNTATGIAAMFHAAAFKIVPPLDNPPDNPSPAPSKSLIDELNEAVSAGGTAQPCAFLNASPICLPLARAAIPATRSRYSTTCSASLLPISKFRRGHGWRSGSPISIPAARDYPLARRHHCRRRAARLGRP